MDVLASNRDLPLRLPLPPGEIHFTVEPAGPLAGARVLGLSLYQFLTGLQASLVDALDPE